MKTLALMFGLLFVAMPVSAQHVLRAISWPELKAQGKLRVGEIVTRDGVDYLRITNASGGKKTINIANIDNPGVTSVAYTLRGNVAYKDVEGRAYLEMWSVFPDGERYFTRTLDARGPLAYISGTSDSRLVILPFFLKGTKQKPERLTLNVVMPGNGEILIGPLELNEYANEEEAMAAPGQWWSERTGAFVGSIAGILYGLFGALIGVLSTAGRSRGFVLGIMRLMFVVGIALLIAGIAAIADSQPYAVWYPLVLTGVIATAVIGGLLGPMRKRYDELELRKMKAQDLA